MTTLPTDIDTTYSDEGGSSRKLHQQHHDILHALNNSKGVALGIAALDAAGDVVNAAGSKLLSTAAANAAYVAKADLLSAVVEASESTTSTTYTDLATVGPFITLTVPASGRVLLIFGATLSAGTAGLAALVSITTAGANTIPADDTPSRLLSFNSAVANQDLRASRAVLLTGLAAGSTTFALKYRSSGAGTTTYAGRSLQVIPF